MPGARFFVSVVSGQWPEGVAITDAQGSFQFEITGSSSLERLSLRDAEDRELAVVRRHVPTGGFEVVAGGRQVASVRRRFFGRYRISISGEDIATRGSVGRGGYVLTSHAGDDLAVVSRSGLPPTMDMFRLSRTRIRVDVKAGSEPVILPAVLAIEWLFEESWWPYWLYG